MGKVTLAKPGKGPPFLEPEGGVVGKVKVPTAPTPQVLGQKIEAPIRDLIAKRFDIELRNKSPSATGPDIVVPDADRIRLGFDIADVKPINERGLRKFWDQLDGWREKGFSGKAAFFGYDGQGNVYLHGIYEI